MESNSFIKDNSIFRICSAHEVYIRLMSSQKMDINPMRTMEGLPLTYNQDMKSNLKAKYHILQEHYHELL